MPTQIYIGMCKLDGDDTVSRSMNLLPFSLHSTVLAGMFTVIYIFCMSFSSNPNTCNI